MKNKIAVVGSYNMDITIHTDRIPVPGETVLGRSISYHHGGKGANQAVAAVRCGAEVSFIGRVGADIYGTNALQMLQDENINTQSVAVDESAHTGVATIAVNDRGENCIIAVPGANALLSPADIQKAGRLISDADIMVIQLETPLDTVEAAISTARKNGTLVILNPAPACELPERILSMVDIFTPNRGEAEILSGIKMTDEKSLADAAYHFAALGIQYVMITLGEQGVYLGTASGHSIIPAFQVKALDTTGAGDVFNGVLAGKFSRTNGLLREGVSYAAAAASLSVTRSGAQSSIPFAADIDRFISQQSGKN